MNRDDHWDEVAKSLIWRAKGRTWLHALNRLLEEQLGFALQQKLKPANCVISQQLWPLAKLVVLCRRHSRVLVQGDERAPVIVVNYFGRDYLIDGTTRINKWDRDQRAIPHTVLLISHPPGQNRDASKHNPAI